VQRIHRDVSQGVQSEGPLRVSFRALFLLYSAASQQGVTSWSKRKRLSLAVQILGFHRRSPSAIFDRMEWAGAFGDLGTLIPFVLAYVSVMGLDPLGVLLGFGVSMIATPCGIEHHSLCNQ
jgi:hypothetical protein